MALIPWFVKLEWNTVLAPSTGWHTITYWQALGLFVLAKILFGGFRGPRPYWGSRRRMLERYAQMSPEEREKFREGMRMHRCGGWDVPPPPPAQ
ncbi:MAG TPA: hypothetical protein VG323_12745 [Thermoanaerobaculia bacterium]|nr:hypothetical protein [Thermoanaerobaculia bacterium]